MYVDLAGQDNPDCGALENPCETVPYAVNSRSNSGDTIQLQNGTFLITEALHLKDGVTLQGMYEFPF